MSRFDFYEFAGVLAPGVAFVVGMSLIFQEIGEFVQKPNFSLGDLGVIVIIAYITGHLLQGIGNILESIYWAFWGGRPTDWVRSKKHKLISEGQVLDVGKRLKTTLVEEKVSTIHELSKNAWASITNEMYGSIKAAELDARAHIFNGNYGLMRGIAAALLLIMVIMLVNDPASWKVALFVLAGFILAMFRMHRFGRHYAREVFTSYLNISQDNKKSAKKAKAKE